MLYHHPKPTGSGDTPLVRWRPSPDAKKGERLSAVAETGLRANRIHKLSLMNRIGLSNLRGRAKCV
jgi:hypothetical protein